jgi:hypothetical protein
MYSNPDSIGRIAREHHHEMIAANRQRQLLRAQDRPAPRTATITRRLAGAMAKVRVATVRP